MTLDLNTVDTDGAIREALDDVGGDTRADVLRKATVAAGGLLGGAAVLGLTAQTAAAATAGDVKILNFALTLEYLESAFYDEALEKAGLDGDAQDFARLVASHEATHVTALRKVLGGKAIKKPSFDFKDTTSERGIFLETAQTLEDTGVAAYKGQAPRVKSDAILAAALSIHSVEARHAAYVRTLRNVSPVIAPLDKPKTMAQILRAVKQTGFITG